MESRLISAFRKTKSIVNQISSNSRLSRSEICIFNEPSLLIHSKTYTSFSSNLIPASQTSIIRSLSNLGFKAFRHHYPNYKVHFLFLFLSVISLFLYLIDQHKCFLPFFVLFSFLFSGILQTNRNVYSEFFVGIMGLACLGFD